MNFIAEIPWWLPVCIAAIGVILFVNAGLNKSMRLGGVGAILLAILMIVVSVLLDSDRETIAKRSRALVAAVEQRDWKSMESLLDPHVLFMVWKTREAVVENTKVVVEQREIKEIRLSGLDAKVHAGTGQVTLQAIGHFNDGVSPPTNWALTWEQNDGQWLLVKLDFTGGMGISESFIRGVMGGMRR